AGTTPPTLGAPDPAPPAEKRREVPFDAAPAVMAAYLKPTMPHPDDFVFDVLDQVMCEGRTSRLYRRLVAQDRMVQNIGCSSDSPGARLDNAFFVYASILPGHTADEVLKTIDEEFQRVLREGVPEDELKRAKKSLRAEWNYEMQSDDDMAQLLSYFEAVTGSWKYVVEHPKRVEAVTSKDIQRVVRQYLAPERRRAAILTPKKS